MLGTMASALPPSWHLGHLASQLALLALSGLMFGIGLPFPQALLAPAALALGQALAPSASRAAAVGAAVFWCLAPWAWLFFSSAQGTRGRDQAALSAVALTAALLGIGWLALRPKAVVRLRAAVAGLSACLSIHGLFFALGLRDDPYMPDDPLAIPGALAMLVMLPGLFFVVLPPATFWRPREERGFDRDLAAAALTAAGIACVGGAVYSSIRPNSVLSTVEHVPILAASQLGPAVAWLFGSLPDAVRKKPPVTVVAAVLAVGCTRFWFTADSMLGHFLSFWMGSALWSIALFGAVPALVRSLDIWSPEAPPRPMPPFEFHVDGTPTPLAEAAAPSEGPSAAPQEGERFVSSGGFRLDRARALEKLREHQFQRPEDFAVAWLRAAVASRATRLDVDVSARSFRMRFDGDAFSHAELTDPFHALLDGGEARARELGFGLLGALRFEPGAVVLASGRGGDRSRLSVTLGGTRPEAGDSADDTVIEARWRRVGGPSAKAVAARLRLDFGFADLKLTLNGEELPSLPPPGPTGWMEAGDADCRLLLAPRPEATSSIQVYRFGARAGSVERALDSLGQVEALVRDDRLSLDASRGKVVRDGELQRVLAAIEGAVPGLVSRVATLHAEEWPRRIAAARRAGGGRFRRVLRRLRLVRVQEEGELERWEVAINRWLTQAALREPGAALVGKAPLYRAEGGDLYTLEELGRGTGAIAAARPGGSDPSAIVCRDPAEVQRLADLSNRRVVDRDV